MSQSVADIILTDDTPVDVRAAAAALKGSAMDGVLAVQCKKSIVVLSFGDAAPTDRRGYVLNVLDVFKVSSSETKVWVAGPGVVHVGEAE